MAPKFLKAEQEDLGERQMTTQDIIDATGEVEVETLEEVEIIFGNFTEIGGLEPCSSLLSLTLVNCGLLRLSNFAPVSMTLERLCLPDQKLTKIEGLHLPCLRELHLQQNKITKIEGLEGVPHLQRLWLWGNKITRIEGLTGCGELRELYLQSNRITRISGLSSLVHLESLGLAHNRISDYYDLENLSDLPLLKEIGFRDIHFGECPLCSLDGYRSAALLALKYLTVLDGVEVTEEDRRSAKQEQLEKIVAYNNKVEELERFHEREMRSIEQRRKRVDAHATVLESEMKAAFSGLENIITSGRESILMEHKRQIKVRKDNTSALSAVLSDLSNKYETEIQKMIEEEKSEGAEEMRLLTILEDRTKYEIRQNNILEQLKAASSLNSTDEDGSSGYGLLGEHTPSFQLYARHLRNSQCYARHTDSSSLLQLVKGYHVFSKSLANFHATFTENPKRTESTLTQLYWCGTKAQQEQVLKYGFRSLARSGGSSTAIPHIALHSDPSLALAFYQHDYGKEDHIDKDPDMQGDYANTEASIGVENYDDDDDDYEEEDDGFHDDARVSPAKHGRINKREYKERNNRVIKENEDPIGLVVLVSCSLSPQVVTSCSKVMPRRPKSIQDLLGHAQAYFNSDSTLTAAERFDSLPNMSEVRYSLDNSNFDSDEEYASHSDGGEEEEDSQARHDSSRKAKTNEGGFAVLVKTCCLVHDLGYRFYPEAHFLVASGGHGMDARRLDRKLEELSQRSLPYNGDVRGVGGGGVSMVSEGGGSGGLSVNDDGHVGGVMAGWNLLDELEVAIEDELSRYSERLWEGVDPDTADRLREADSEVSRKEEALALLRGQIETERQSQETLIRSLQSQALPTSMLPQQHQGSNTTTSQHILPPQPYQQQAGGAGGGGGGGGGGRYHASGGHRGGGDQRQQARRNEGRGEHRPRSAANNPYSFDARR